MQTILEAPDVIEQEDMILAEEMGAEPDAQQSGLVEALLSVDSEQ
jgi:hypothetical protein